jgi:hypothetical protein
MVVPEVADAPVMLPVFVPNVQANELAAEAVSAMLVAVPLQRLAVFAVVTTGVGLTVAVIEYALPAHDPAVDVGVTK